MSYTKALYLDDKKVGLTMNIKKIISRIEKKRILRKCIFNVDKYMKSYVLWLKKNRMDIVGFPKFINPDVYFDGTDYSKIHIGNNVTISREVMILTHDYSITAAMASLGKTIVRHEGEMFFLNDIYIGENSFIGARASILPGSRIGKNVIVGACSVVKGVIPDGSIVVGNPCKIIGSTAEYAEKHIKLADYLIEK